MPRLILVFLLCLALPGGIALAQTAPGTPSPAPAATGTPAALPQAAIRAPRPGQALQGSLSIQGRAAGAGFQRFELLFAYHGDPTGAWFLIAESSQPVESGELAAWDTTTLTDGVYDLRLEVFLENGETRRVEAPGLRVRNYTPVETDTPTPVTPTATTRPGDTPVPTPSATPTETPLPSSTPSLTPLPPNPGELGRADLERSLGRGALATTGLFALMGLYFLVRRAAGRV